MIITFDWKRVFVMYYNLYHHPTCRRMQNYQGRFYNHFSPIRQYPPTDPSILSQSVKEFQTLMQQGVLLLNRLADTTYAKKLMEAAQQGDQSEVDRLIHTIDGLFVPVNINYSPSGAIFILQSPAVSEGGECCTLNISLKWGQ